MPLLEWLVVNPPRVIHEERDADERADDPLTSGLLAVTLLTCGSVVKLPP
jgi:hypothetical protein